MNQYTVEEYLADLPLGGIRYFDTIGSTNNEAAAWIENGASDLSLLIADEQTAGRGRSHRKWFTYPHSALAFSLVLRPNLQEKKDIGSRTSLFSGLGAVSVMQALRKKDLSSKIKWPNDVIANGRKLCGILAEAHWIGDQISAIILGIGINISPAAVPPEKLLNFPATCIETELGKPVDRLDLLHAVLSEIIFWRRKIRKPAFIQAWEAHLAFKNKWVKIISPGEVETTRYEGLLDGLDGDGSLILISKTGEKIILRNGEMPPHGGQAYLRPVDSS